MSYHLRAFILLCVGVTTIISIEESDYKQQWNNFKTKYNRKYANDEEENQRYENFKKNLDAINGNNEKYTENIRFSQMSVNEFADVSEDDIGKLPNNYGPLPYYIHHPVHSAKEFPVEFNWVEKGAVTSVSSQNGCESSYAFAATGVLEGAYFVAKGKLLNFSEQEIIDCTSKNGNKKCEDNAIINAYEYIMMTDGLNTEDEYPNVHKVQSTCGAEYCTITDAMINYVIQIDSGNENSILKALVTNGPVAVRLDASHRSFLFYSGGIYDDFKCQTTDYANHNALIVGYGHDNKTHLDYWILKNSWGEEWGEKGYMRIVRGQDMCHLSADASYAVVV